MPQGMMMVDEQAKMAFATSKAVLQFGGSWIKVTRADFIFPDWEPGKDYVPKKK